MGRQLTVYPFWCISAYCLHFSEFWPVPDRWGDTPIHGAARHGHIDIVKILVPLTYNPNRPNNCGKTPIYWAYTEICQGSRNP